MNYIDLLKTMKATVLEPSTGWENNSIVLYSCCGILCLLLFMKMVTNSTVTKYASVFSFLKGVPGIEVEDAGETNYSNLFSVSVSASTQHFNLNTFVNAIGRMGCSVLSTADTDNPSYRTLTVEVPKNGGGWALTTIVLLGMVIGLGTAVYYNQEEIYNTFPFL